MHIRPLTLLKIAGTVAVFSFFSLPLPQTHADGGYQFRYDPAPPDAFNQFNFSGVSHPVLKITPQIAGPDTFTSYQLDITDRDGNPHQKTAWTPGNPTPPFTLDTYSWDLCRGNTDQTEGYRKIILKAGDTANLTEVYSEEIFIVNYSGQCSPGNGENVPQASWMTLERAISGKTVDFTLSNSNLSQFDPSHGPYEFKLYINGPSGATLKDNFSYSGGAFHATWDTSGTPAGDYSLFAQFKNTTTGTSVDGPTITIKVGSDGTPTDPGGGPGGGAGGSLDPLNFTLDNTSRISNAPKGLIFRVAYGIVIQYMIAIFSGFAMIAFVYSGIMYATSYGDPAKAEKAKKNLSWAVLGVVIMLIGATALVLISKLIKSLGL